MSNLIFTVEEKKITTEFPEFELVRILERNNISYDIRGDVLTIPTSSKEEGVEIESFIKKRIER